MSTPVTANNGSGRESVFSLSGNTRTLRSKFEQLSVLTESAKAKRSVTLGASSRRLQSRGNQKTSDSVEQNGSASTPPSLDISKSTETGNISNSSSSWKIGTVSKQSFSATTSVLSDKEFTSNSSKQTSLGDDVRNPPSSRSAPPSQPPSDPLSPVEKEQQSSDYESARFKKRRRKPKPDPNRVSSRDIHKQAKEALEKIKVEEKALTSSPSKTSPSPASSLVTPISNDTNPPALVQKTQTEDNHEQPSSLLSPPLKIMPSDNIVSSSSEIVRTPSFEISEKWRINFEDLEFADLVSTGSAGEVYLGYYFGTPVAIKKLFAVPNDQRYLVQREFSMLQGVNHPNIVQFLGICDHSSGIYLITEYVEHGDLFDLIVFEKKQISWKVKVKIALQIAQACYYLHSKNIIHRDLKSQNVLIGDNYKVKLCDLGLATMIERSRRMTVCGTNEWMAPEIVLNEIYDYKVDIFSFGIVCTELITNEPPRKREIDNRLAFDIEQFQQRVPPACPVEFLSIVFDCTRENPSNRCSFKEIVPKLRNLMNSLPDEDL